MQQHWLGREHCWRPTEQWARKLCSLDSDQDMTMLLTGCVVLQLYLSCSWRSETDVGVSLVLHRLPRSFLFPSHRFNLITRIKVKIVTRINSCESSCLWYQLPDPYFHLLRGRLWSTKIQRERGREKEREGRRKGVEREFVYQITIKHNIAYTVNTLAGYQSQRRHFVHQYWSPIQLLVNKYNIKCKAATKNQCCVKSFLSNFKSKSFSKWFQITDHLLWSFTFSLPL